MKIKKSSRKAISPLLATIILIAITIVGGLVVYSIFTSSAGAAGSQSSVTIVSDQLVLPAGTSTATWAITVKNTGNKPIVMMDIKLSGQGLTNNALPELCLPNSGTTLIKTCSTLPSGNLSPGQSASGSATIDGTGADYSGTISPGGVYTVTIISNFADGSTATNVFSVQATSS
jgi:flagellin-like protein